VGNHVYFSNNNALSWSDVSMNLNTPYVGQLAVNSTTVFASTETGVWQRPLSQFTGCHPPVPVALSQSVCQGGSATLTATGSGTFSWYSDSIGGNYLQSGNKYITAPLDSNFVIYAQDSTCAPSRRTAVTVTVHANPDAVIKLAGSDTLYTGVFASYQWLL